MKILIPLLALTYYLWLAVYSYHHEHGYSAKEVSALNNLVERVTAQDHGVMFIPANLREDLSEMYEAKPVELVMANGERQ